MLSKAGPGGPQRPQAQREVPVEMPPKLAEWGCDAELWNAIKSKRSLLKLMDSGNEEYARKRLERARTIQRRPPTRDGNPIGISGNDLYVCRRWVRAGPLVSDLACL